jgi:hypothetical protein
MFQFGHASSTEYRPTAYGLLFDKVTAELKIEKKNMARYLGKAQVVVTGEAVKEMNRILALKTDKMFYLKLQGPPFPQYLLVMCNMKQPIRYLTRQVIVSQPAAITSRKTVSR